MIESQSLFTPNEFEFPFNDVLIANYEYKTKYQTLLL